MPDAIPGGGANFLTKKWGPLPIWVYAVAGGALITLIALYKRGGSTTAAPGSLPASNAASDASGILNYPPTVVVTPAGFSNYQPATSTTTPAGSSATTGGFQVVTQNQPPNFPAQGYGTIPFYSDPAGQNQIGWLPWSTPLPVTGPATTGRDVFGSKTWYPVLFGSQKGYISSNSIGGFSGTPVSGQGAGLGGALRTTMLKGQSRYGMFAPFQPSQYVNTGRGGDGMGDGTAGAGLGAGDGMGEGMGGRAMAAISKKTGIPLIRLKSLNPQLFRPGGSYAGGNVRIA